MSSEHRAIWDFRVTDTFGNDQVTSKLCGKTFAPNASRTTDISQPQTSVDTIPCSPDYNQCIPSLDSISLNKSCGGNNNHTISSAVMTTTNIEKNDVTYGRDDIIGHQEKTIQHDSSCNNNNNAKVLEDELNCISNSITRKHYNNNNTATSINTKNNNNNNNNNDNNKPALGFTSDFRDLDVGYCTYQGGGVGGGHTEDGNYCHTLSQDPLNVDFVPHPSRQQRSSDNTHHGLILDAAGTDCPSASGWYSDIALPTRTQLMTDSVMAFYDSLQDTNVLSFTDPHNRRFDTTTNPCVDAIFQGAMSSTVSDFPCHFPYNRIIEDPVGCGETESSISNANHNSNNRILVETGRNTPSSISGRPVSSPPCPSPSSFNTLPNKTSDNNIENQSRFMTATPNFSGPTKQSPQEHCLNQFSLSSEAKDSYQSKATTVADLLLRQRQQDLTNTLYTAKQLFLSVIAALDEATIHASSLSDSDHNNDPVLIEHITSSVEDATSAINVLAPGYLEMLAEDYCQSMRRPMVLAHPDEFKNPSSFLKIYGDPQCIQPPSSSGSTPSPSNVSDSNNKTGWNQLQKQPQLRNGKDGNWECPKCRNVNYPRRFRCNNVKCRASRDIEGDKLVSEYTRQVFHLYLLMNRQPAGGGSYNESSPSYPEDQNSQHTIWGEEMFLVPSRTSGKFPRDTRGKTTSVRHHHQHHMNVNDGKFQRAKQQQQQQQQQQQHSNIKHIGRNNRQSHNNTSIGNNHGGHYQQKDFVGF